MAKRGRGNKAIDELSYALRAQVDALIDSGMEISELWDAYPAVQTAISLRSLQDYAKDRRRSKRVEIVLDEKAVLNGLIDHFGLDHRELDEIEKVLMGAALKEVCTAGKTSGRLNGVLAALNVFKHRRKETELAMVGEKFEAWKLDYQRREQERLKAADRKVADYGQKNGLSDEAIAAIQNIYGIGGDDRGGE